MATTERSLYESRDYQPNFIRGNVRNPMRAVSNAAAAPQFNSIQDTIVHDNRTIRSYYQTILESQSTDEQTRYQNQFTWELARHTVAEELVVYPAFEKYMKNGKDVAEKGRKENETIKVQLKTFQDLDAKEQNFLSTLNSLMDTVNHHIEGQESNDLPTLMSLINKEESYRLSQQFDRAKMFMPSRAHPGSSNKLPFATVQGLLAAPSDKLVDMFRKWPESSARIYNPKP